MKTITIGEKTITLDIGDELRVKDLKKIAPILANQEKGKEIDMIIDLTKALGGDIEVLDNLNITEFTKYSEELTKLLDTTNSDKKKAK